MKSAAGSDGEAALCLCNGGATQYKIGLLAKVSNFAALTVRQSGMIAGEASAAVTAISRIPAVPSILDVVCRTTGMGFAAVARVTDDRWIACNVKDDIAFGLQPGGELKVETTICS